MDIKTWFFVKGENCCVYESKNSFRQNGHQNLVLRQRRKLLRLRTEEVKTRFDGMDVKTMFLVKGENCYVYERKK